MKNSVYILTILFIFTINISQVKSKDFQFVKFKRFNCEINSEFVYENFSCFTKPINRNSTGLNMFLWFKKPVNFAKV